MRRRPIITTTLAVLLAGGCADLIGFPDYREATGTSASTTSAGGSGGAGTTSSTSSTSASQSSTTSASGGTGGTGGVAPQVCEAGTTATCYSGAPETLGVGPCVAGTKTCLPDGTGYGACSGETPPSVERCDTPTDDESCDGIATCTGQLRWARGIGDPAVQLANAIAAGPDGKVAVAGNVQGTVDLGGGSTMGGADDDVFVAVYGRHGQHVWSKRMGDVAPQNGLCVAMDPKGSVVVAGSVQGTIDFGDGKPLTVMGADGFVARYDAAGALIWAKLLGDMAADAEVAGVTATADGSTYIAGRFSGTLAIPGCTPVGTVTISDAFVARFDPSGTCTWLAAFGGAGDDRATAITIDKSGNVVVAGTYKDATIDVGTTPLTNGGDVDTFVAKLAPGSGAVTWARSFSGALEQVPAGIAAGPGDTVYVVGSSTGMTDFGGGFTATPAGRDAWLVKLDAGGNTVLATPYGGAGSDYGLAVAVDGLGNVIIGLSSDGSLTLEKPYTSKGDFDTFVSKLDATDGHVIWTRAIGDPSYQAVFGLATDGMGNVAVAGVYAGAFDLGGSPLVTQGGLDAFVLSLAP